MKNNISKLDNSMVYFILSIQYFLIELSTKALILRSWLRVILSILRENKPKVDENSSGSDSNQYDKDVVWDLPKSKYSPKNKRQGFLKQKDK